MLRMGDRRPIPCRLVIIGMIYCHVISSAELRAIISLQALPWRCAPLHLQIDRRPCRLRRNGGQAARVFRISVRMGLQWRSACHCLRCFGRSHGARRFCQAPGISGHALPAPSQATVEASTPRLHASIACTHLPDGFRVSVRVATVASMKIGRLGVPEAPREKTGEVPRPLALE